VQDDASGSGADGRVAARAHARSLLAVEQECRARVRYVREGEATVKTPFGQDRGRHLSQRAEGSPRVTRFWCAPWRGHVPMRVEQKARPMRSSGPWRPQPQPRVRRHALRFGGSVRLSGPVLAAAIPIGRRAHLIRLEEQHLRHAFVRVDLRGAAWCWKFQRDVAFPLRLQSVTFYYAPAARVRAFP